jgi:hypothetical protein
MGCGTWVILIFVHEEPVLLHCARVTGLKFYYEFFLNKVEQNYRLLDHILPLHQLTSKV